MFNPLPPPACSAGVRPYVLMQPSNGSGSTSATRGADDDDDQMVITTTQTVATGLGDVEERHNAVLAACDMISETVISSLDKLKEQFTQHMEA